MNADHEIKVPTGVDDRQNVLQHFNNDLRSNTEWLLAKFVYDTDGRKGR